MTGAEIGRITEEPLRTIVDALEEEGIDPQVVAMIRPHVPAGVLVLAAAALAVPVGAFLLGIGAAWWVYPSGSVTSFPCSHAAWTAARSIGTFTNPSRARQNPGIGRAQSGHAPSRTRSESTRKCVRATNVVPHPAQRVSSYRPTAPGMFPA